MHQHLAWPVLIYLDPDHEYKFGIVPLSHDDLMIITNHDENVDQHDENVFHHDANADQYLQAFNPLLPDETQETSINLTVHYLPQVV